MEPIQTLANSTLKSIVFCNLINVYNTRVNEPYEKKLLPDNRDMYGLFLTLEGSTTFVLKNGKKVYAAKNSIFFVKVSELSAIISKSPMKHYVNYWFMAHGISLPLNKAYPLKKINFEKEIEFVTLLIEHLQTHVDKKIQYANVRFTCRLLEWLDEINYNNQSDDFISEVVMFINENVETGITVKKIAQKFGYCVKHTRTLFQNALGLSPKQYIDTVRLERASTLLITTNMPLQEIADKFSFSTVSHFINAFKKKYGESPTNFRQLTNNKMHQVSSSPIKRKKVATPPQKTTKERRKLSK
ncbi:MAG: helix-turn-helix transcriptional regulator [Clostridia bacterium]|nr:helix-turn-helix transcriptional regulator [Clostridia bacterium]MBR2448836.1 helix-turn-helix transcriptional regulator [Clostridia bacterium]